MSQRVYDIAVIGSGFAGSLMAMICHRLGRSVILLEKGRHPRFTIGESSTPLTNLMLEDLTTRYNLPALTPLAKWGTWQETYPHIACGLKRGFTFYHHTLGQPDAEDPDRRNQLLVAASPNDTIADTHWYRPHFDQFFASEAQKIGVEYLDRADLDDFCEGTNEVVISGLRMGEPLQVHARFVIDATGPHGFLNRTLKVSEIPLPGYPHTQALYTHFTAVGNYADQVDKFNEEPPYPIDSAAVHHVFNGGWIWVLKFNNGITSAGVAATNEASEILELADGAKAWQGLLAMIPKLQNQFANAKEIRPFTHVPKLSFRSAAVSGTRWVQLPSAAGFVDPLLSTGFAMTLLGLGRLAEIIECHWNSETFSDLVAQSASQSEDELLATSRLIGSLYATMGNFPLFVAVTHLYFTAVIFSETVRRLGKPEPAASFLLHGDSHFGPLCAEIYGRVKRANDPDESRVLCNDIIRALEPFNLAGLGSPDRRNWYPVNAEDLYKNAPKIHATIEEITALLKRSGFAE